MIFHSISVGEHFNDTTFHKISVGEHFNDTTFHKISTGETSIGDIYLVS